jgi:hypothetical protein
MDSNYVESEYKCPVCGGKLYKKTDTKRLTIDEYICEEGGTIYYERLYNVLSYRSPVSMLPRRVEE